MNNKNSFWLSAPFVAFIMCLAAILYVTGTAVSINVLRSDISLVKSQNRLLQNDMDMLKVENAKLNSRLRYTATVTDLAIVLDKQKQFEMELDNEIAANFTLNEILTQMFGNTVNRR